MVYVDPSNVTTIVGYFQWSNAAAEGWLGTIVCFGVLIVSFLALKANWSYNQSFAAASTLTALVAIFFFILGLVSGSVMYISIILALLGFVSLLGKDSTTF